MMYVLLQGVRIDLIDFFLNLLTQGKTAASKKSLLFWCTWLFNIWKSHWIVEILWIRCLGAEH